MGVQNLSVGSTRPNDAGWILRRSLIAGAAAGAIGSVVLLSIGQPQIRRALAIEKARGGSGEAMFSRSTQVVGGVVASVAFGVLLGLIFGVVFMLVRHRIGMHSDLARTLTLAAFGFVAVSLVPFFKYPSNPPAVGDSGTVASRTWGYIALIIYAIVAIVGCWRLANTLRDQRRSRAFQIAAATVLFMVAFAAAMILFPPSVAIPEDMPTDILWRFRLSSIGQLFVTWLSLGLVLGWLLDHQPQVSAQP